MGHAVRVLGALGAAVMVTLGLFWLMHHLIRSDIVASRDWASTPVIEFRQIIPESRREKPPRPKPEIKRPDPPPEAPELELERVDRPFRTDLAMRYDLSLPFDGGGPYLPTGYGGGATGGGQLVPLLRISPPYPYRAALAGIEGWVKVEFTVTETGSVIDPEVVASQPPRIFDQAAVKAILKWKFQPRSIDGQPVRVRATQTIDFHLAGL